MWPIFPIIVGSGRSGTTLLRAIFDSHPELAITNEAHFIAPMIRNSRQLAPRGEFRKQRFLQLLINDPGWRRLGISKKHIQGVIDRAQVEFLEDAVRLVFAEYAAIQRKARYGDKTPSHVKYIRLIGDRFPETRFLHIVRDGRDVAASTIEAPLGANSISEAAWSWRSDVLRGRKAGASLGTARYLEISYEDLVDNTEAVVRSACRFVGVPFDNQMLTYYRRADALLAQTGRPKSHMRLTEPPSRRRNWRTELTISDVRMFEAIAGDTLNQFGYQTVSAPASYRELGEAVSTRALWHAKRVRYALKRLRRVAP